MLQEKIIPFIKKNIKWILIILGILILILVIPQLFKSKNNKSNTETKTISYSISSDANENISGNYIVEERTDGSVMVKYAIILQDSDLVRNGRCIDTEGSNWCDDPDHQNTESVHYRYTSNLEDTNNPAELHATYLQAIYANLEEIKADPHNLSISLFGDTLSLSWDQMPKTDKFLLRGSTTYASMKDFLATDTLKIYDAVEEYRIRYTYEESTYTGRLEQVNGTYENTITRGDLVKTYDIQIEIE